ncbi:hypothetical protein AALP_AA8G051000 [Arabis alpina]|uniref:PHD finger protein ALFIN-LIKE n=1 Tax=Arabis alpina TaxID=50452 RepID=A0A087G528_ARAAL|nr:hypothetical protein AALP_AA8G051000 [Arabis alpina]
MYRRRVTFHNPEVTSPPRSPNNDSIVDAIFTNLEGRRLGFIRAFSTDVETLHAASDPEDVNLCLFAYPNGTWEVKEPSSSVPSNLPQPVLGINFSRDGLSRLQWLTQVSIHSDSWLLSLAYYHGYSLTRDQRNTLFDRINDLPTLHESVVNEYIPSTVEDIFTNFTGRRDGFFRALFTDVDTLYGSCDPVKEEKLCLYAYPSGTWKVSPELMDYPSDLPEPVSRINFARARMTRREWRQLVARHSDSWLLSLAFFYGSKLSRDERNELFDLINDQPTLYEEVTSTRYNNYPRTVEEIFTDFAGRLSGFLRAFFIDVDALYASCDPALENLCLYAYPNETWNVSPPLDIPTDLPEPVLGINFVRDEMLRHAWLQFVALHCDLWLLSVAFFFGWSLSHDDRNRLFDLINDRPTLYDQVTNRPPT